MPMTAQKVLTHRETDYAPRGLDPGVFFDALHGSTVQNVLNAASASPTRTITCASSRIKPLTEDEDLSIFEMISEEAAPSPWDYLRLSPEPYVALTTTNTASVLRSEIPLDNEHRRLLETLDDLYKECSHESWDGYGARQADKHSLLEAKRFARALPATVPTPDIAVDPDGEFSFEWYLAPERVLTISVGPKGEINYAGIFGRDKAYGLEHLSHMIPDAIIQQLDRLYASDS